MTEAKASTSVSPVAQSGWMFAARGDGAVRIVSPSGEFVNLTAKQWNRVAASLRPASRLMEGAGLAESAHERYWSKVALPGANGCMLWIAGLDQAGYGQFQRGDRTLKAHQVSWWFANGLLASGLVLDHYAGRECSPSRIPIRGMQARPSLGRARANPARECTRMQDLSNREQAFLLRTDKKAVTPTIGTLVHYTSFGTPGGEYTQQCRAAIVTEVGAWVTVETTKPDSYSTSEGRPIRTLEQWFYDDALALTVCNPTGLFFNGSGSVACKHDEPSEGHTPAGGTWHWPEQA